MMMSVPHPQNLKLLPLGIFMSADGGDARPGNAGLAMFGPHEKTWAKLLRWAANEGWLILVRRGGARRGPSGTTIVRASVYAASVPQLVWKRREEILGAPPFRAPGVEGSAPDSLKGAPGDSPDGLKGAPDGSLNASGPLKGAIEAPFNSSDSSLKGASSGSLPDSLKGAPRGFEGSVPSFEGSAQALHYQAVTPSTSTTPPSAPVTESSAGQGGGGGEQQQHHQGASLFVEALDYRGRQPSKTQRLKLSKLVAVALGSGWSETDLKAYLDLGDALVKSAAAIYLHRLNPDELPEPPAPRSAPKPAPGCPKCDDGHYDTGEGWAPCPHCNRNVA